MNIDEKIQIAANEGPLCRYCEARSKCTGGSMLIPGGPTMTACTTGNYKDMFVEALFDEDHPQLSDNNKDPTN